MGNSVFEKKPPKHYVEGFVKYEYGLDTNPNFLSFISHGYSPYDAYRMLDLYAIEGMKYHFKEAMEEFDPETASEEELQECKECEAYIEKRIAEYNRQGDEAS